MLHLTSARRVAAATQAIMALIDDGARAELDLIADAVRQASGRAARRRTLMASVVFRHSGGVSAIVDFETLVRRPIQLAHARQGIADADYDLQIV